MEQKEDPKIKVKKDKQMLLNNGKGGKLSLLAGIGTAKKTDLEKEETKKKVSGKFVTKEQAPKVNKVLDKVRELEKKMMPEEGGVGKSPRHVRKARRRMSSKNEPGCGDGKIQKLISHFLAKTSKSEEGQLQGGGKGRTK